MASSHSLQWDWIKENRIKATVNYAIALSALFNKPAARYVWYFRNLCFKLFVRIHRHLVHILQVIEAAAAENTTYHGSKTLVILHLRDLAKITQVFTGNYLLSVAIL